MPIAYHTLCITILATHRQVQAERIGIDHVDVTRFGAAKRVNATVERFVGAYLDGDTGVFAVDRNYGGWTRWNLEGSRKFL